MNRFFALCPLFFFLLLRASLPTTAIGQDRPEPELAEMEQPLSYMDLDIRNGVGFRLQLNNFGFAVGGEYRRVLSRYTTGIFEIQVNGVRDESEQTFQSYLGYSVIPNKYNRVLAFPALFGVSRRLFAENLSDNFRVFVQASGGPSPTFVYPYYNHDLYGLGFLPSGFQQHYDVFQGWGEGTFILGGAGHLSIGANIGGDFGSLQSIRIGYFFNYYPDGIQIMEPRRTVRPDIPPEAYLADPELRDQFIQDAASKQHFFGTPHITFVFGTMW